jgi:hypothetical protein
LVKLANSNLKRYILVEPKTPNRLENMKKHANTYPSYSLVMTACIDPNKDGEDSPVSRSNPEHRLLDYESSLRYWLELKDDRVQQIIFIDNSGYTLDSLKVLYSSKSWERPCEFISLNCNELTPGINYGYSEFKLLDLGLSESKTFENNNYLIKVTGRYRYPGISRLLSSLPEAYDIAADARILSHFVPYPRKYITLGLILFSVGFYNKSVRRIYNEMRSQPRKAFAEDILFDRFFAMRDKPEIILSFPCNCEPVGIGGNGDLLNSPRKKIISMFRAVCRIFFPNWWL